MKRCPNCQSIYTDESLVYCLQDGSKLVTLSDSASTDEATLQISRERSARPEPAPTEILHTEDMPTARIDLSAPTREQRARATAIGQNHAPAMSVEAVATPAAPPRKSNAAVIALSVVVALLLVTLGGLITWIAMRDKSQAGTSRTSGNTGSPGSAVSPADRAAAQAEVEAVLNKWADSISRRNLDENMSYYAEMLEVYYNARNVSRDRVRDDKELAFSKYTSMEMKLSNIKVELDASGRRATATFDKTFNFRGGERDFNGSGLNRFLLVKEGANWRIAGEQDLKTYYINR